MSVGDPHSISMGDELARLRREKAELEDARTIARIEGHAEGYDKGYRAGLLSVYRWGPFLVVTTMLLLLLL
jgi:hypothetical protein